MGTITRTFANNITTSGVFKPTAFNNASFDNVTAVPSGAVEGGNMVLLSTQTASASASISFTTGIDSTYKEYMFIFNNIHVQTNGAHFQFNFSTDGGSSYNVTKTSTHFICGQREDNSGNYLYYTTSYDLAESTANQVIFESGDGESDSSLSGTFFLFNPSSTTYVKHFISEIQGVADGTPNYSWHPFVAGYGNTTSAINAVQFNTDLGNIETGTIQMFGIL
jgi:hypothetical protein